MSPVDGMPEDILEGVAQVILQKRSERLQMYLTAPESQKAIIRQFERTMRLQEDGFLETVGVTPEPDQIDHDMAVFADQPIEVRFRDGEVGTIMAPPLRGQPKDGAMLNQHSGFDAPRPPRSIVQKLRSLK